jgi:myo-inositol-1(or 4)-monophosphatase
LQAAPQRHDPVDDDAELLALAREAVHRAGTLIRTAAIGAVTDKGDRDLQSSVDLASEQAIREFLARETPSIPLLGEETGGQPAGHGRVWVLDPLDGTINYLHGLPLCAVSLSLLQDSETAVAATHLPFLGTTYTALSGGGAFANGEPVSASRTTSLRNALISIDQYTFSGDHPQEANETRFRITRALAPLVQRLRVFGTSTVDLAWTASGRLDACIIAANNPWDTSAGVLLAREAGALVFDLLGTLHSYESASTVAVAPGLAQELADLLRRTLAE